MKTLLEKVYENRESLKQQDAWAYSVAKKDFMIKTRIIKMLSGIGRMKTGHVMGIISGILVSTGENGWSRMERKMIQMIIAVRTFLEW